MKLEITKEKVLEEASKCSTAKETLKTLFPEVFEEDKYFELSGAKDKDSNGIIVSSKLPKNSYGAPIIQIRNCGIYENRGFFLSRDIDWRIEKDGYDLVLIPTKK